MTLIVNIYVFWLTKCTIYYKKCSCCCFFFLSMLLLCSFFRLKELFNLKNDLDTSSLFTYLFFENAKNLGRLDDTKRRKKEGGLRRRKIQTLFTNRRLILASGYNSNHVSVKRWLWHSSIQNSCAGSSHFKVFVFFKLLSHRLECLIQSWY